MKDNIKKENKKVEKPINLKAKETEEQLVKLINESNLPAFILKPTIEKIYKQLEVIEQEQLRISMEEYNKALENENKTKKEGEKDDKKNK